MIESEQTWSTVFLLFQVHIHVRNRSRKLDQSQRTNERKKKKKMKKRKKKIIKNMATKAWKLNGGCNPGFKRRKKDKKW